jgi:hypothetical protein
MCQLLLMLLWLLNQPAPVVLLQHWLTMRCEHGRLHRASRATHDAQA